MQEENRHKRKKLRRFINKIEQMEKKKDSQEKNVYSIQVNKGEHVWKSLSDDIYFV